MTIAFTIFLICIPICLFVIIFYLVSKNQKERELIEQVTPLTRREWAERRLVLSLLQEGVNPKAISYSYDQYDKSRYVAEVRTHDHDYSNRQHIVHALYTKFCGRNALTAGADYMNDYLTTYQFTDNESHSQTSLDAFVQFDYNPTTWLNVIASVRDDYFSESDNNALTSRLATMFKLKPLSIRASYSGGFRSPTLKEMYICRWPLPPLSSAWSSAQSGL